MVYRVVCDRHVGRAFFTGLGETFNHLSWLGKKGMLVCPVPDRNFPVVWRIEKSRVNAFLMGLALWIVISLIVSGIPEIFLVAKTSG
jgi:hypothetical protein